MHALMDMFRSGAVLGLIVSRLDPTHFGPSAPEFGA